MNLRSWSVALLLLLLPLTGWAQEQQATPTPIPDIPYEKFVLDNGLTVIVHEDHKAPIVAVNVWYHVGSKNEPAGRSGFAHLFEHLMFNGSENFDDDYFQVLERVGATDLNGTTNTDRTNYFQNVPTSAVDVALWMESDRMGHLLGAIDQEKLDEQRGVVQNEKRQGENQPYGQVWNLITDATWPEGHPYAHTVIGSMDDLNAASLEDVHEWFKTYYGPNNAVVVIAGDITAEEARAKAEQFFGDIPPGPPIAKFEAWVPKMQGTSRQTMQDRVPQARLYKVWNVPESGATDYHRLSILSDVLSSGKTSRLYKRLVYDDQLATDVAAYLYGREIASQFVIQASARPGVDLADVEAAIDEELARLLREGPTDEELARVKTGAKADFVRGIERIGGFGGKSDILAQGEVYGGTPEAYKETLAEVLNATPAAVQQAGQDWLSDGVFILEVHPFPALQATGEGTDRSAVPTAAAPPKAAFPEMQHTTLSNGMEVILAERHVAPIVNFNLYLDAGYASDQTAAPGTASLAMSMLDEGADGRSALEIADALQTLGAELGAGSSLDMSNVYLSALRENLDASLDLMADVVLRPDFPEADLDRLKKQQLARIQREKVTPVQMALRVFPQLIYGEGHAYSLPFTGSGTEASVMQIDRAALERFHQTWFKPNNATMVVVGDITMDELKPALEQHFGAWRRGDVPAKNIATVDQPQSKVYLMDRPGAQQSIIFAGHLAPPTANPNEIAIETMNTILGGSFTSRVNMNLREDKGWSYGASTLLLGARGQRPFLVYAPVQTDKTKESVLEIRKELRDILADRPVTADEVDRAVKNQTLTLAGRWETMGSVASSIGEIVTYELDDDYWDTYAEKVRAMDVDNVGSAAGDLLRPDHLVWIVVGDREQIEPGLRELNLGEIVYLDGDGNVLGTAEGTN